MSEHFDLVAIGGGFAGLVAALRGAELGLRTAVLEQGDADGYPCSSRWAGGVFHVSYSDVRLGRDALLAAIMKATGGAADPAQAEAVAADGGRAVDWLQAQGARFTQGSRSDWHRWVLAPQRAPVAGPDWRGRGPDLALGLLRRRLEARQGRIFLATRARALQMADRRCVGVAAAREGVGIRFDADATVIADGGFPANAELFRRHIGPRPDRVLQRHAGTARGDGLIMAEAAGAALVNLDRFYGHLLSRDAMTDERLWPYPQIDAVAAAAIVVDAVGHRVVDEGQGGIAIANQLARLSDPLCGTVICDARIWDSAGRAHQIPPNPLVAEAGGTVHRAETLAALAAMAGIDPDGLAETVVAYNGAVREGNPARLTPPRSGKAAGLPIEQPPFLAIPICAGITNTMGGIAVDGDARVRRADGSTIPGLYAAGGATGGLEGGGMLGYVGGLIKACVLGLRAAEYAARTRRR